MSELSNQATVTVRNPQGLHMRPADMLVRTAGRFESNIVIEKAGQQVDCKSILGILTLGATQGSELNICANGPDSQEAISEIVGLFDRSFDET
jgi:phosphotransferase system HPr (HPr) family protein